MSCTFWLRRKKRAAMKAAEAAKQATVSEMEKVAEKKPAKKGGAKKNDNEATV